MHGSQCQSQLDPFSRFDRTPTCHSEQRTSMAVQKRVFVGLQLDRDALRATDTGLGEPGLTTASHHGRVYSTLSHVARPPLSKALLT